MKFVVPFSTKKFPLYILLNSIRGISSSLLPCIVTNIKRLSRFILIRDSFKWNIIKIMIRIPKKKWNVFKQFFLVSAHALFVSSISMGFLEFPIMYYLMARTVVDFASGCFRYSFWYNWIYASGRKTRINIWWSYCFKSNRSKHFSEPHFCNCLTRVGC